MLDYQQAIESGIGRYGQPVPPAVARASEADLTRRMTFPDALDEVWEVTGTWGTVALLIAVSIQTGEEFDNGTARTVLIRGVGRGLWPISKVLAYLIIAGLVWLLLALLQIPIGFWTQSQTGIQVDRAAVQVVNWLAFAGRLLRAWVATVPYIGFATGFALLARGAGPALALGLGLRFVEIVSDGFGPFLVSMKLAGVEAFSTLYRLWAPMHAMSFDWNTKVWTTWGGSIWSEALVSLPGGAPEKLPGPLHSNPILAGGILLLWSVVWIAVGAWSLRRRDITS